MTRDEFKTWCAQRPALDFDKLERVVAEQAAKAADRERIEMRAFIVRCVEATERTQP